MIFLLYKRYSQFKICFERLNLIEKMLLFTVVTSFFCYLIGISRFYHFIGSKILGNISNFISKRQELQKMLNTYKMTRYTIVKSVKFPIKWYIFLPYKIFFRGHPILRLVSTALLIFHEDLFLKDHLP